MRCKQSPSLIGEGAPEAGRRIYYSCGSVFRRGGGVHGWRGALWLDISASRAHSRKTAQKQIASAGMEALRMWLISTAPPHMPGGILGNAVATALQQALGLMGAALALLWI